jgi:hypothetical protein
MGGMMHFGTKQRFRHTREIDGERYVIWASGVGDVAVAVRAVEYRVLVRDQPWQPNFLTNEGEADILDVYFDDQAVRTSLFLRLYNTTVTETSTLAAISATEVSGTGYGAITVTRGTDWTDPGPGGTGTDMSTKQFAATGTWTDATYLVLATVGTGTSGLIISANALSTTRTLQNGDTLDIDLNIDLE